ncbi:MAG: dTDP-4-amino-4,6-dideoxygalactose transaminase [Longimicrobiales bacterium]
MSRIPFNVASQVGRELEYLAAVLREGQWTGNGPYSSRCQDLLERALGASRVLLTPSCTHALEMCSLLLGVTPGDEVIVPSFTFVSTVNAFVLHGARPVFCDIRADTLNLDEEQLEDLVTPRTRAIVPVHYAGVGCEMDVILEVANRHGIPVVEDNAHGLFGRFRGKPLGTFGSLATQSFHGTKNFTCGEGGALILNDAGFLDRAEIIREKGTDRSRFFRGQVDKYTWTDIGSSYLLSEVLAVVLLAQLEVWESVQETRRKLWKNYFRELSSWARERVIALPTVPEHCDQAFHMFYLLLPSLEARQSLIDHLKTREISAVFHYQPLHISPMGKRFGGRAGDCPVTESVSERLLRLPFYNGMEESDQERVIGALCEWSWSGFSRRG